MVVMEVRELDPSDVGLVAEIDRTQRVDYAYRIVDGELDRFAVDWDVPRWYTDGDGPHTVASMVAFLEPIIEGGGRLLAAMEGDAVHGIAVIVPEYEPGMGWLAFLHVTNGRRRTGVGTALWAASLDLARAAAVSTMYVSATPSGPTIDFYLGVGCRPTERPHPVLFDMEPEDIHLLYEV